MPERATVQSRSEKSAEAVVARDRGEGPNEEERPTTCRCEGKHQMPAPAERVAARQGEAAAQAVSDEALHPRHDTGRRRAALLRAALARENMQRAWKRVKANKGAAGVDGLDIAQTGQHLSTLGRASASN